MSGEKYFVLLKQSTKNWKFWAKLLIGLTQIVSAIVFITVASAGEANIDALLEQFSYFTTQSNVFCGYFFIYSAMFHHNEGKGKFDNSEVAKLAVTYITLTIIIYNANQLMLKTPYLFDSWKYVMSLICEHTLFPIFAVTYYLFFYNHEKASSIKEFSKKWVWIMVAGLLAYVVIFSIIGEIAKVNKWKPIYTTIDGSGELTTFVYPFFDWYHAAGFFKSIPPWAECIIILLAVFFIMVGIEYLYTLTVLKVKSNKSKIHSQGKNKKTSGQGKR